MGPKNELILAAASAGQEQRLRQLLARDGTSINVRDRHGQTPLMLAARSRSLQCIDVLIAGGADIAARDHQQQTVLHHAVDADASLEVVERLLGSGADVDAGCELGRTPLILAVIRGRIDLVKVLIKHGANPNSSTPDDETPLSFAVVWNRPEVVKVLADSGADVDRVDRAGWSLMDYAKQEGNSTMMDTLTSLLS